MSRPAAATARPQGRVISVRIVIEAASKADAELIAQRLPVAARAESWRGFGVIRLGAKDRQETEGFIQAVSRSFQEHKLQWARVRYDDEERVFKANGHRPNGRARRAGTTAGPADQSTGSASGSARPAMR